MRCSAAYSRFVALCVLLAIHLPISSNGQDETLIPFNSAWRFRKGTNEVSNPVSAWRVTNYADSAWTLASAPFHYGEGLSTGTLLSGMRGYYTCIFLRRTFVITNVAEVQSVRLQALYDDGFVAWINGTEVARSLVAVAQPVYTNVASGSHEATSAELFSAAAAPQSFLVPGTNVLAVQAFNRHITNSTDFRFDGSLEIAKNNPVAPAITSVAPAPGAALNGLTQITVTFTEPVIGIDAQDLLINDLPASGVIGAPGTNRYTFILTQPPPGSVAVEWNSPHETADLTGTPFDASGAIWSYTLADTIAPVATTRTPVPNCQVSRLTQVEILFSEPVQGVNASDLLVNGQPAASVIGSDAGPYVFAFPQPNAGTVQFSWAAGHGITDFATVPNSFAGGNWSVTLSPGAAFGDVIISEFVAGNLNGLQDENGTFQDWIELYNRGSNSVNLLGWSLTDDARVPGKWTFPSRVISPGQFLVVFASEKDRRAPTGANRYHTNFKLNPFGEYLALYNPESPGIAVSEFAPAFPEQRNDYSYGLDAASSWHYYQTPTPGTVNGPGGIDGIAPQPHFSVARGLFSAPFTLLLTTPLVGAAIRYTTDGSEPGLTNSAIYTQAISITNTTILRAATFAAGYLPSRTVTHSYLYLDSAITQPANPPGFPPHWGTNFGAVIFPPASTIPGYVPADYEMDLDPVRVDPNDPASAIDPVKLQRLKDGLRELPVVSLVLNQNDMFGPGGLYPESRASPKIPNEKAVSLEMLLPDGTTAFVISGGLDLHGNASRDPQKNPKHGFKLGFKGDYGESSLKYRLFPDSPAQEFDDLILRADFGSSWRHWSDVSTEALGALQRSRATRTRDAWFKETFRDMGHVASHSRFFHLFINGLYWGTYDFTEQANASFAPNYFGGSKGDFDIYDQGALKAGTSAAYNAMVAITGLTNNSRYELMKQYLDVTEHIDSVLMHFFIGHQDWGGTKNWYAIRKRVAGPEGTFKYLPWDGENFLLDENIDRDKNPGSYGYPSGLQSKLIENAQYRLDFADRVYKHMIAPGGALTPPANVERWKKWLAILDKPIVAESARWGDYRRDMHQYQNGSYVLYTRENQWLAESNRIVHSYLVNRNATVLNQLRRDGLYPNIDAPEFRQNSSAGALLGSSRIAAGTSVAINNPAGSGTVYYTTNGADPRTYYSGAISDSALAYSAPINLNSTMTFKARLLYSGTWSALNEATFTVGDPGIPLRITEINYNPMGGGAYEFIEIQNIGGQAVNAGGFSFSGITFIFPEGTVIAPGATLVLASSANPAAFALRYPSTVVFGNFDGSLANGGERIAILDRDGRTVTAVHYEDTGGWPATADGLGYTLEVVDPRDDPSAPANWRASAVVNGNPGLPPAPPAPPQIVLSEVMAENLSTITNGGALPDWIEIQNRSDAEVNLAGWSLSDDSNPRKFVFPPTPLPAGGYLVVWCDTATSASGVHAGFALSRKGESVFLFDANSNRMDAVSFGMQLPDLTVGRIENHWQLNVPTPGRANVPAITAAATNLAINEWLANPSPGAADWIELFNQSAAAPVALKGVFLETSNALFQIRSLSFVAPHGYVQLFAEEDTGPDNLEFKLPASGGAIRLYTETAELVDQIVYGAQTAGVSEGRLPDGTGPATSFVNSVSPGASNYLLNYSGPTLNEVLARNQRGTLAPWNTYADFVELYNPNGTTANLGEMGLANSGDPKQRWIFPAGTSIGPASYLLVWCDPARPASTNASFPLNTGFSLDGESGEVFLFNTAAQAVDHVNYGFQIQDQSIGKSGGLWQLLSAPTPGAANAIPAPLGPVSAVRINEWMANPLAGDDWIELYNTSSLPVALGGLFLTDDPSNTGLTKFQMAPLSFIDGRKWVKWIADDNLSAGRNHAGFALDDLGESIRLYDPNQQLIDFMDFDIQKPGISQGRLPDGAATVVGFSLPTPDAGNFLPLTNVVINEVLTHTDPPLEDAIELYNPTAQPVAIGGWYLSDSFADPKRFRIPDGTTIPAEGFRVFYQNAFGGADGESDAPPLFSFNSAHGDSALLSEADALGNLTGYTSGVTFGAASNGVSFGRFVTTVGEEFTAMSHRTFGEDNPSSLSQFRTGTGSSNAYPQVGPVVINEIMYHPSSADPTGFENPEEEFIELHNLTDGSVALFDPSHATNVWRIDGGVQLYFPVNISIPAHGYLLLVGFDPTTNVAALSTFQRKYGTHAAIVGPYSGRLNNSGETLELLRPDVPQAAPHPDAGFVPLIVVDRVAYSSMAPWPIAADGGGASLQRLLPSAYGNDPDNWKADAPTAARTNAPTATDPPTIAGSPKDIIALAGQPAEFQVSATGAEPLTYVWFFEDAPLDGAIGPSLPFHSVGPQDEGNYRVLVTNAFGSALSDAASLTVLVPPSIGTEPGNQIVKLGFAAQFTVAAGGTVPLHYQWQHNGLNLAGRTNASLAINPVGLLDAGNYRVVITNVAGSATSAVASLTVQAPPMITSQPRGGFVAAGSAFILSVSATGDEPLTFQWQRNSTNVPGSTGPQLVFDPIEENHSGYYSVLITNPAGSISSDAVLLTVLQAPALISPQLTPQNEFLCILTGPSNRVYAIDVSTNLIDWIQSATLSQTNSQSMFMDPAPSPLKRYYRARLIE